MSRLSSTAPLLRLLQIRRVIKKHGLADLLGELNLAGSARLASRLVFGSAGKTAQDRAVRIRLALEELGPIFIKLGQALSTRPDLLPQDVAQELSKLQDQVPPFSGKDALSIIAESYGDDLNDIFESIEEQPMASASVAQVHVAQLKDGLAIVGKNGEKRHQVIIKVLRPGVKEIIDRDVSVMYFFAKKLQRHWTRAQQFKPLEVIRDYDNTIHGELDLRQEAANCSQMAANFENNDLIYVPTVYWDYTQTQVMVMERIYGTSVRDIEQLKALGYDMQQLAADGVETFFKQAFEDNFFHADMHPGNIFVSDRGKWIAIDFGIMGVLGESDKQYLAEMLLGFFHRDYRTIAESHLRAGWIPAETNIAEFESAIRMVCEPNFAKPISDISFGLVLMQLFQTIQRFEMPAQPQLVLLYKTLLNIEGLGRQLYPQLNLWDTAKPFLENWMKQQLSPQGLLLDLKRDWPRWRALLADLPEHLTRLTEQSKLTGQQQQLELEQKAKHAQQQRLSAFHQRLGLATALVSGLLVIATENAWVLESPLTLAAPWMVGVGLVWAYWQSR
jgi:ubiquinone biosynthesis protein